MDTDQALRRLARAIVLSIPALIAGSILLQVPPNSQVSEIIFRLAGGLVCYVFVGVSMVKPLAVLMAQPIVSLVWPEERPEKPPPLYRVPEYLVQEKRFEEALSAYEKIIGNHPAEFKAHVGVLMIYKDHIADPGRQRRAWQRALRCVKDKTQRKELEKLAPSRMRSSVWWG